MPGKYQPYPGYKDSGLKWLGDLPQHWNLRRSKHLFTRKQRKIRAEDEVITAFRDGQVTLRNNRRTEGFTNSLKEIGYQGVRIGDLLVHAMDGFAGAIGVSDSDGKCSPVCSVCVAQNPNSIHMTYYGYLVRQLAVTNFITSLAKGIRERSTEFRFNEFAGLLLAVPPKSEQIQIANFLDHETAKIDTLIAKQEKLIELLQEKRQAVISHAVTKGLDPDVPMKDSGVEWLGEVPTHWEIIKVKCIVKQVGGGTPSKENEEYWKGDIPWVSPKDMKVDYIKNTIDKISPAAVANSSAKLIPPGSILIVVRGMILIHSVPVAIACNKLTINQDMKALLPSEKLQGEYFLFLLKGIKDYILDLVDNSAHGTKCLRTDLFEKMTIPIPPIAEQKHITDVLKSKAQNIDRIKEHSEKLNLLLKERRTALISAAVTGKIDVRNWEPKETQNA